MSNCSQCGTMNKGTARYCRGCGFALKGEAERKTCSNGHKYKGEECPYCLPMSNCSQCGTMNKGAARFCRGCGIALKGEAERKTCGNGHKYQGEECPYCPPWKYKDPSEKRSPFICVTFEHDFYPVEEVEKQTVGYLRVIEGLPGQVGRSYSVHDERNIIRKSGTGHCSIPIDDPAAAGERPHALLDHKDGDFYLKDNGSAAGTRVNGRGIRESVAIKEGDKIQIGGTVLVFSKLSQDQVGKTEGQKE